MTIASYDADLSMVGRDQALPWILAHHQRTPTNRKRQSLKEFRRLAFEGVADELENPSEDKQASA